MQNPLSTEQQLYCCFESFLWQFLRASELSTGVNLSPHSCCYYSAPGNGRWQCDRRGNIEMGNAFPFPSSGRATGNMAANAVAIAAQRDRQSVSLGRPAAFNLIPANGAALPSHLPSPLSDAMRYLSHRIAVQGYKLKTICRTEQ